MSHENQYQYLGKAELTQILIDNKKELRSWRAKTETPANQAERTAQIEAIEADLVEVQTALKNLAATQAENSNVGGGFDATFTTREDYRNDYRAFDNGRSPKVWPRK